MQIFYSDTFVLPLPAGHRFPMEKYARLRARVSSELSNVDLRLPPAADDDQLAAAHAHSYIQRVSRGELDAAEQRRIGFPWSTQMVERSRRSAGATLAAARAALHAGVAVNLAGGTHHAFAAAGSGYCVFNDAAVTAKVLLAGGELRRLAVIDADVHQGDGTAAILADEPRAFTFSIHGAQNFPFRKQQSDLDIALEDGVSDDAYLDALEHGVTTTFERARPELVIYLAGADPYFDDRLGRLHLTKAGLAERDRTVLAACRRAGVAVATAMAGGYARVIDDTVDIHLQTVLLAAEYARG
jgi:acetoin utilization deacetylase AcuC-like enzyme